MEITVKTAQQLRLTEEEFELIKQKLGRTPNFTELCAFSGMWSEHCSYKNSIKWLKTLPRDGGRMLVAAGEENAGLMDIGNDYGVVFKIESHNHPSALEPFQGAATGVGGIQRDIFTMGARPIASLNSLRFGKLDDTKTKRLLLHIGEGGYKATLRLLPWFFPQLAIAGFTGSLLRAFNKVFKPSLEETTNYKTWWGKTIMKIFNLVEGNLGINDPLSKIFFISDGL
jgi:hypothetical protein